jgi:prepilin-type processing-associated H-X9-DG protein
MDSKGFKTLLALLVVAGLCFWYFAPRHDATGDAHAFDSDSTECVANLRAIYAGLLVYIEAHGHPPEASGVRFLAELIESGTWPNDEEHARKLTCPGVPIADLALAGRRASEWFADPGALDGSSSAYAGRDQARSRLTVLPADRVEPLVACDNAHGANHADVTNVLMADGSVLSLELETEIELGNLPPDATRIPVGPDSPIAELRGLSLD